MIWWQYENREVVYKSVAYIVDEPIRRNLFVPWFLETADIYNIYKKKKKRKERKKKRNKEDEDEKKFFLFSSVISQASSHPPHNRPLGSLFPLFIVLLMNHVCNSKTCSRFEWAGLLLARNIRKPRARVRIKKLRLFVGVHCISMHRCLFKCSCIGFVRLTFNSLETRFE